MQNQSICTYCGKDTSEIEYDYLDGQDHLECILQSEIENSYIEEDCIIIPNGVIHNTPNDYELGEKIRKIYWENKNSLNKTTCKIKE
jgi:hypothetical protein